MKYILLVALLLSCSKKSSKDNLCNIPEASPMNIFGDEVLNVHVKMNELDWQSLKDEMFPVRYQPVDIIDSEITKYHWYKAEFYLNGNKVKRAKVRKKSRAGSFSKVRPGLKIKSKNKFWGNIDRLTLNNNIQDDSYLRQCLTYKIFRTLGYPAPKCQLSHVCVNNERMGIYTNVQGYGKDFLKENLGHSKGSLYEGDFQGYFHYDKGSDFYSSSLDYYEKKFGSRSWQGREDFKNLVRILKNQNSDLESKESFKKNIDLDKLLNFLSLEHLTFHWDGFAGKRNNHYFFYNQKTEKIQYFPWGTDMTLKNFPGSFYDVSYPAQYVFNNFREEFLIIHDENLSKFNSEKENFDKFLAQLENNLKVHLSAEEKKTWPNEVARLKEMLGSVFHITAKYLGF